MHKNLLKEDLGVRQKAKYQIHLLLVRCPQANYLTHDSISSSRKGHSCIYHTRI